MRDHNAKIITKAFSNCFETYTPFLKEHSKGQVPIHLPKP